MFKGRTFYQDVFYASNPTITNIYWDFACSGISDNTIVISLQLPGKPGKPSEIQTNDSFGNFYFGNSFATQSELDSNYPDGNYILTVKNAKGDTSVETIDLSGSLYPAISRISNILAAQCIDSGADFTLTWDALVGGSTNDLLLVSIVSREDGTVFQTPYEGNGMLNGSFTSVTIPKNTLKPGIFYQVAIMVERAIVANQASNPGIYKKCGYYSELNSSIKTLSNPPNPIGWFLLGKGQSFSQSSGKDPVLSVSQPWSFTYTFHPDSNFVAQDSLVVIPKGTTNNLPPESPYPLEFEEYFSTKKDLDADYPVGTYIISILTSNGTETVYIDLPSDTYPVPPHINNFPETEFIDARLDSTISWDPFIGGRSNDYIHLTIFDMHGYPIFETPLWNEIGALNGSATSVTIPQNTLLQERTYSARLLFGKAINVDTNRFLGVSGAIGYYTTTTFPIRTLQPHLVVKKPIRRFGIGTLGTFALSPDGQHFATGGSAGAFIWEIGSGKVVQAFEPALSTIEDLEDHDYQYNVTSVTFSPDGKRILTGSDIRYGGYNTALWDAESGRVLHAFQGGSLVGYSPDGKRIYTIIGSTVKLWNIDADQFLLSKNLQHSNDVKCAAFSPDGKQILIGGGFDDLGPHTGDADLWDAETGQKIHQLTGHTEFVSAVAFSPDGRQLFTGSHDYTVRTWDAVTGQLVTSFKNSSEVRSIAVSPDGKRLAVGGVGAILLNRATGQILTQLGGQWDRTITDNVAFSVDGKQLFTASANLTDMVVRLWNIEGYTTSPIREFKGHITDIQSVAISPDDQQIATASGCRTLTGLFYGDAVRWNKASGEPICPINSNLSDKGVAAVDFSKDGNYFITAYSGANLWDMKPCSNSSLLRSYGGSDSGMPTVEQLQCVAFSPDSKQVLTGGREITLNGSSYGLASLFDITSGSRLQRFQHTNEVVSAAFSPDGKQILTGTSDKVQLWDATSGKLMLGSYEDTTGASSVAFSPDGKKVLIGGNGVNLLEAATGKLVQRIENYNVPVSAVAFSPDGAKVITTTGWSARLWDTATGEFLMRFEHGGTISSVAFTSHGTEVLTGSLNGTAKLWDIQEVIPRLRIQRTGSVILLEWNRGTLQVADNINGPWSDLTSVNGSIEVHPTGNHKFYRVRIALPE